MTDVGLGREVASILLEIGAVELRPDKPFRWASGLLSPVYCDNRLLLGDPLARTLVTDAFVRQIEAFGLSSEIIAGTATAGIPHAAWLAARLGLPMSYVRSSAKEHGRSKQIEGADVAGNRVLVIEDLVSTGGSSIRVVDSLRDSGASIVAVLAIFTYGLKAAEDAFEASGTILYALSNFPTLLDVAEGAGLVSPADVHSIRDWHTDPSSWTAARE